MKLRTSFVSNSSSSSFIVLDKEKLTKRQLNKIKKNLPFRSENEKNISFDFFVNDDESFDEVLNVCCVPKECVIYSEQDGDDFSGY